MKARIVDLVITAVALLWSTSNSPADTLASHFYDPAPDRSSSLPADRIYPQGRIFPFSGYSGKPDREKANGFTMHGPVYGPKQLAALEANERAGLAFPYTIGLNMKFHSEKPLSLSEADIKKAIAQQVAEVAAHTNICWWYLQSEEIRYWRKNEIAYLKAASEAIHAADPMKRPVWMYDPNHRDAKALVQTGAHLDLVGKGSYVNYAGYQDRRVWVRWGIEQEVQAIRQLGGQRVPLLVPELCKDPEPGLFGRIPAWVRHDVYCGLIHGAKGIVIWSLFKRPAVRQSYDLWYSAYAEAARQLTGERKLGEVFLFGELRQDLTVKQISGTARVTLSDKRKTAEAASLSEREKAGSHIEYPALSWRELACGTSRYLFVCNSSPGDVRAAVSGYPAGSVIEEADTAQTVTAKDDSAIEFDLAAWGVRALKFSRRQ